jgi:protein gp37
MSDLFHADLPDGAIDRVFAVMALTPHITYQVLTKRADRLKAYFRNPADIHQRRTAALMDQRIWGPDGRRAVLVGDAAHSRAFVADNSPATLPNVWLGVSVEDQATADERIPHLQTTPAAVRFISYEPALDPIDISRYLEPHWTAINWVICGGESGPGARPMHPDWARSVRDQCQAAGVPFFFKQMTKKAAIPEDLMIREFPNV